MIYIQMPDGKTFPPKLRKFEAKEKEYENLGIALLALTAVSSYAEVPITLFFVPFKNTCRTMKWKIKAWGHVAKNEDFAEAVKEAIELMMRVKGITHEMIDEYIKIVK